MARLSIGLLSNNAPSDRQLMSIGASEHRAFVRAKARFAGPKGSGTHFVHRDAVIPEILPCIVGGIFWRKVPRVPCPSRSPSVRPARSHSLPMDRLLPGSLPHQSLPGVSRFRCFRCYLNSPPAPRGPLTHLPPPGVSLFRHFRCYLHVPSPERPFVEHPPARGTSPCAPGAFSLTAMIF